MAEMGLSYFANSGWNRLTDSKASLVYIPIDRGSFAWRFEAMNIVVSRDHCGAAAAAAVASAVVDDVVPVAN